MTPTAVRKFIHEEGEYSRLSQGLSQTGEFPNRNVDLIICKIHLNSINPQRIHSFVRGCGCVVSMVTIRVGVGSCLGAASINSLPQYFGHRNDWRM